MTGKSFLEIKAALYIMFCNWVCFSPIYVFILKARPDVAPCIELTQLEPHTVYTIDTDGTNSRKP